MLEHLMSVLCSPWLYLIVAVAVAVDGVVPVVPSEALVISLGAMSATGSPHLLALGAAVVVGGVAGDRAAYLLGRKAGARATAGKVAVARAKAERALLRYGGAALLIGRFLPYGRTASTMTSGSVSLPVGRFHLFSMLASVCWAVYTIGLGRLAGATFAGSPLLGAAFGLLLGTILAGVCAIVEKRRGAAAVVPGHEPVAAHHSLSS
ncbi:VTT domain-containing protein [Actinoplanes sp. NEAU-A12]|uniref:VTT domain-containing protein n=1 Tax=Actinoplanes sandaracinus TaxID=3045177 RepID=A0ABT6WGP4_9ACTN|nr:VTT domain-containing protein [Actinoplanes sandaracinus]MDI6098868.1 VTT domain-containing protein [Actinoplanes sandaracinus]